MTNNSDFPLLTDFLGGFGDIRDMFFKELQEYNITENTIDDVCDQILRGVGAMPKLRDYLKTKEVQKKNNETLVEEFSVLLRLLMNNIPEDVKLKVLKGLFSPGLKRKLQVLDKIYKD
jgi:hypothetical protein